MSMTTRPLGPSSIDTTRNPDNPRIHVQSRRDPTRPPLLVAHQERTPSNPGWQSGIAFRHAKTFGRRPAIRASHVPGAAGVKAEARRGRALCGALTPGSTGLSCRSPAVVIVVLKSTNSPFWRTVEPALHNVRHVLKRLLITN